LISGISKKVIFFSFLLINFIQPTKSAELPKINKDINNRNIKTTLLKVSNLDTSSNYKNYSLRNDLNDGNNYKEFFKKNTYSLLVAKAENQQELIIQSDKQSEISDVIYAEGNVSVSYRGKLLKADKLIYDKSNKKIEAKGNITLIFGDQFFRVSQLEYSFISEKGYLLDVKGVINTNTLIDDISSNFSLSDSKKLENLIDLNKKEVINTPENIQNWWFFTEKMTIDGDNWKSKKAIFSNDLLELKQAKWQ
jgi:Organic solvent tolerance protein OstA